MEERVKVLREEVVSGNLMLVAALVGPFYLHWYNLTFQDKIKELERTVDELKKALARGNGMVETEGREKLELEEMKNEKAESKENM